MCYLKISAGGMWVGTPWGGCVFHGSEISYLLAPAASTLDELHLSRIRADVANMKKSTYKMELGGY